MEKKKDIYTYEAPWLVYAMGWSYRADHLDRLAIGSFLEDHTNSVEIVELGSEGELVRTAAVDHPYPATKVMWMPDKLGRSEDLLATSGDYLRLWQVTDDGVVQRQLLSNNKNSDYCAPLTSFDWNERDFTIIGTSSIDTTCTIWNIERQQAVTQLIAHDKEVFDLAFSPHDKDVFASVGADGSVRMFDLRDLEHSTIIYENQPGTPLLRLCWNRQDSHYLATMAMDSKVCTLLDKRVPSLPVAELGGHSASLNSICWAPHSSCHLSTAGDDKQALIWDIACLPKEVEGPILVYNADAEINQLQWSSSQPDWIAAAFGNKMQVLRV